MEQRQILAGKAILLLENELFIALEMAAVLKCWGVRVVGPAFRLEQARSLMEREQLDAAILDVKLNGDLSLSLAQDLKVRGVPVMLVSGYNQEHLPPGYGDVPRLLKPVQRRQLHETLAGLLV